MQLKLGGRSIRRQTVFSFQPYVHRGLLGMGAQDGHLDRHTVPALRRQTAMGSHPALLMQSFNGEFPFYPLKRLTYIGRFRQGC